MCSKNPNNSDPQLSTLMSDGAPFIDPLREADELESAAPASSRRLSRFKTQPFLSFNMPKVQQNRCCCYATSHHCNALHHCTGIAGWYIDSCMNSLIEIGYDWHDMINHEFHFCSEYRSCWNLVCNKSMPKTPRLPSDSITRRSSGWGGMVEVAWANGLGYGCYRVRFGGLRSSADFWWFLLFQYAPCHCTGWMDFL